MLTPEQIAALRDAAGQIADPINNFLLEDIARRIAGAGQLTGTVAYQVWRAQQLGLSQREIKKRLRKLLGKSRKEINKLLTQAAEVGYRFDLERLPTSAAIPFEKNTVIQQMVSAAVKLAQDDFINLTQTLGMVGPDGVALPLQEAYRKSMDYAFEQVFTGAADYNTAIRRATGNLADMGIRVIDYESGVHTGLEAAVRRNIMGGLGLMQEQITQQNHDDMGCDGWEISAHAASAPDHEPIQGRQYSDAEYEALNDSLVRRIGTLNCGHAAFPIILGVNSPQHTEKELRQFREDNEKGITYEGWHYTMYEATQQQRKVERAIRRQKNRILVDEATGDSEKLTTDRIRLQRLNQEYARFSKATGLPTQRERAMVAGFGRKETVKTVANTSVSGIIKLGGGRMDLTIDQFTPCLMDARTGKLMDTSFSPISAKELHKIKGWGFDWSDKALIQDEIYKLTLAGDDKIQGLVAIRSMERDRAVYVHIAESAPHNLGSGKQYSGVGGHLFAIAAQKSVEAGYGGYFFMDAKNLTLVKHYQETLGAMWLGMPHEYRMIVDEEAAAHLLSIYTFEEGPT